MCSGSGWMSLRDALCKPKQALKAPNGSNIDGYWCFPLIQRGKQVPRQWGAETSAGKVYLQQCSTPCHPSRSAVWEGSWFVFLGEEQVREQGRVRPWLNPVQPDLIQGLSDRDTSSCHLCLSRTGHSWGHNLQGKAFPCATRQSKNEQDISTQSGTKMGLILLTAQRSSLPQWTKPGEVGIRKKNPAAHPAEDSGYQKDLHAVFQCTSHISFLSLGAYRDRQELKPLTVTVLKHWQWASKAFSSLHMGRSSTDTTTPHPNLALLNNLGHHCYLK